MSLKDEHKEKFREMVETLLKMVDESEDLPIDIRVLDMLEIAGSLIEQQIQLDIVYERCEDDNSKMGTEFYFLDSPGNEDVKALFFLEEDDESPSAEDLSDWFKL